MNSKQLREIVRETLEYLDPVIPYSKTAEDLVLMTIAHESNNGEYLKQDNGPALGICQMEARTHDDIWENFLSYKENIDEVIYSLSTFNYNDLMDVPKAEELVWNLKYAIAMCRVHYYRVPEALPSAKGEVENLILLSKYAKKYYNTELGKATSEKYYNAYKHYYEEI